MGVLRDSSMFIGGIDMDTNKEIILKAINDFYGNDDYCEEMEEEFHDLAEFIAGRIKEEK